MGYSVVKSFERGIDLRRMIDTTEAGALLDARDCHITRGGEIEKRAAFIVTATMPASTKGFYATRGPTFHTWGIGAAPAGMPPRSVYHNVQLPDDATTTTVDESTLGIDSILSVEEWRNLLYVIVKYTNGIVRHWYNDELVMTSPAPTSPAGTILSIPTTPPPAPPYPSPMSLPPPAPSTTATTIPLPGPTPPTLPTPGRPQCSFYLATLPEGEVITLQHISMVSPSVTYDPPTIDQWDEPGGDFTRLMDNMTSWIDPALIFAGYFTYAYVPGYALSPAGAGAEAQFASLINSHVPVAGDPKVWCVVKPDGRLTVWIEEQTPKWNGWRVSLFSGDGLVQGLSATHTITPWVNADMVFTGGIDAPIIVEPVDPAEPFVAKPEDKGTFVLAHNEKLYCTQQQYLNFSKLRTPAYDPVTNELIPGWWPSEGSGNIDHSMMGEGKPNLVSLADYGGDLAVFADRSIFIWRMDPDPSKNFKRQVLHRTGTIAPHSVVSFGQNEVLYLDRSGIRSLRQREGVDEGFASDLGNNIDDLVTFKIRNSTTTEQQNNFYGDVEPNSGRLWMALHDIIYVLSYFPGNHIAGWTWYDASSYPIDMLNANDEHIYWRSGNSILVYGGETGVNYDATEAMVRVPYIDAGRPATFKSWSALDAAVLGTWQIRASFDPTQPTAFDLLANITKSTYSQEKVAMNGKSPAISLELRTTYIGPARIGNATVHYEQDFAD